jgi:hypothetical protein
MVIYLGGDYSSPVVLAKKIFVVPGHMGRENFNFMNQTENRRDANQKRAKYFIFSFWEKKRCL